MNLKWSSRKGSSTKTNSDAVSILRHPDHISIVLVDGAEKGNNGKQLARHWSNSAVMVLADVNNVENIDVISKLEILHRDLRDGYLHDIASYCMIRVNLNNYYTQIWSCGDCLIGFIADKKINWCTTPHTLDRQTWLKSISDSSEIRCKRNNILTKSLNARRFAKPEYKQFTCSKKHKFFLCTDGYWKNSNPIELGLQNSLHEDDASKLEFNLSSDNFGAIESNSDVDNFYYNLSAVLSC